MYKNSRKLIFFLLLTFLISFYLIKKYSLPKDLELVGDMISDKNLATTLTPYHTKESEITAEWLKVSDPQKVFLFSNLDLKANTKVLMETHSCKSGITGSFYAKENKHIGLFIADFQKLANEISNPFYNGFFSVDNEGTPSISKFAKPSSRISLQSGPLIIQNSTPTKLVLTKDEAARRVVVATSSYENEIIFMIIFDTKNNLFGPTLKELPEYVQKVSKENDLKIVDVLNLDGGSHSAFITSSKVITEAQTVGSIFCIR